MLMLSWRNLQKTKTKNRYFLPWGGRVLSPNQDFSQIIGRYWLQREGRYWKTHLESPDKYDLSPRLDQENAEPLFHPLWTFPLVTDHKCLLWEDKSMEWESSVRQLCKDYWKLRNKQTYSSLHTKHKVVSAHHWKGLKALVHHK